MIRHKFMVLGIMVCTLLAMHNVTRAEEAADESTTTHMEHRLDLVYHAATSEGDAGSADEYRYDHSGLGFGLEFKGHVGKKHLYIDSQYVSDRDYLAEGHLDVNGRFKLNVSSERLWHNLDHIPYEAGIPGARVDGVTAPTTGTSATRVTFDDQNPDDEYGLRVEIDKAEATAKLGNYPAHVRVKYWRMQKEGTKQLRFVEEGHDDPLIPNSAPAPNEACNVCHLQSKTRTIDRVTEEFSGAIDAHFGFFDVAVEQLLRTFRVKDPIPVDNFYGHAYGAGRVATPDTFQHNEDPESQLLQSTATLRTALSGGLVADGAYSFGKRENKSDLAGMPLGVGGVDAESRYQKLSGNLSYTPLAALTVNMRYRMLDLNTSNSDTVSAYYYRSAVAASPPLTFPVRENVDFNRYEYAASAAWRPLQQMTLRGDYQRETIVRGPTGDPVRYSGGNAPVELTGSIDPYWEVPDKENIDQYRLTMTLRPLKSSALRINTWYRYMTDDEPAYGTSFEDRHEVFLGLNYSSKARWGMTATSHALKETNDTRTEVVWKSVGGVYTPVNEVSGRKREQQNLDLGLWANPFKRLTTGVNYGYMHATVLQGVLFGSTDADTNNATFDNIENDVDYLQFSHNCSAFMNIQWLQSLSTRVEGYYVRSIAKFSPHFDAEITDGTDTYPATSAGIVDISRLDVVQQGLMAAIDWSPAERWAVGFSYGIDDYDARNSDIYDGTTQTCMVRLSRTW